MYSLFVNLFGGSRYKWDNNEKHLKPETGLLQLRSGLKVFANLRPASVLPQVVIVIMLYYLISDVLCKWYVFYGNLFIRIQNIDLIFLLYIDAKLWGQGYEMRISIFYMVVGLNPLHPKMLTTWDVLFFFFNFLKLTSNKLYMENTMMNRKWSES